MFKILLTSLLMSAGVFLYVFWRVSRNLVSAPLSAAVWFSSVVACGVFIACLFFAWLFSRFTVTKKEYQLLDVEDRLVVRFEDRKGFFRRRRVWRAFVWNSDGWTEAPGLVGKSHVEGITLSHDQVQVEFPQADISALLTLLK